MISRRSFVAGAAAVAAPYVLHNSGIAQTARVRKDISTLSASDPFFTKYADAVAKLHKLPANDPRHWRNQALIHLNFCKHGTPDFPHWHRHYLANFEAICAQIIGDPGFTLPYWNWTANRGRIPDMFYDLNDLNVEFWKDQSNVSSPNWGGGSLVSSVGTRNIGKGQGLQDDPQRGGAFTTANIDSIQRLTVYNLYTARLETSPHNNGHVVSGGDTGHMGDGMSPLDPIFWLHHCNVDRLWAQWQAAGNMTPGLNGNYGGQFVDAAGKTVTAATSVDALNIAKFNYTYDVLVPAMAPAKSTLDLQPFEKQTVVNPGDIRQPTVLGINNTKQTAKMLVETRFTVQTKDLLPNLFRPRAYWAPDVLGVRRLAVESGRILVKFTNVSGPEKLAPMVVNVFVNCPYLSPETPYEDRHFAGTFSFFGPQHHQTEFIVDLTAPLRALAGDGRIVTDSIDVQLMPQPIEKLAVETSLVLGALELLAA